MDTAEDAVLEDMEKVSEILKLEIKNEYFFPWNRLFEVEVEDESY